MILYAINTYINTLYVWNVEFLKVKPGGTHKKHQACVEVITNT